MRENTNLSRKSFVIWPKKGFSLFAMGVMVVYFLGLSSSQNFAQPRAANQAAEYQEILNQYCVVCHNEGLANAGLVIPELALDSIPAQAEIWERVLKKLHTRTCLLYTSDAADE